MTVKEDMLRIFPWLGSLSERDQDDFVANSGVTSALAGDLLSELIQWKNTAEAVDTGRVRGMKTTVQEEVCRTAAAVLHGDDFETTNRFTHWTQALKALAEAAEVATKPSADFALLHNVYLLGPSDSGRTDSVFIRKRYVSSVVEKDTVNAIGDPIKQVIITMVDGQRYSITGTTTAKEIMKKIK